MKYTLTPEAPAKPRGTVKSTFCRVIDRLHREHKIRIERARVIFEIVAAFFVALETHYPVFALALAVWGILDALKLLVEHYWQEEQD
jgi:hypothetical protein